MTTVIVASASAFALAALAGWLLTRHAGSVQKVHSGCGRVNSPDDPDTADLGLSRTGPTIVHFSAPWCGPCDRGRRVVDEVCDDVGDATHVEIDLDASPQAARQFSVLSLPTTLIFDIEGRQRYRASRAPKAADLWSALLPLLA